MSRGNWSAIDVVVMRRRNSQLNNPHPSQHFAQSAEEGDIANAQAITISGVSAVDGGTATAPSSALGSGACYFGNGCILYDYAGVL
eukprot:g9251.t1